MFLVVRSKLTLGPSGSFDDSAVLNPCVIKVDDTYKMWYQGWAGGHFENRIGYAISTDGIHWTKHPFNPVLDHGEYASWRLYSGSDASREYLPYVVLRRGGRSQIGYATSFNGYTWSKADTVNPVLSVGPSGSWDSNSIHGGLVLFDGTTYHMWYTGNNGVNYGIGYATSIPETGIDDEDSESVIPLAFTLHQNYPNPFNPETRVRYEVSKQARVMLKVMNLLGQEARTLVDEGKPAGFYEVLWDGKNDHGQPVASGVYLYRLGAKDFVQTRKMLLLQ